MTVFALIPVFNRLEHTRTVLHSLRAQNRAEDLCVVVVDDGSTDGTAEYLRTQSDLVVLNGNGNLWWGGAIDLGLRYIVPRAQQGDYVLFLNNDTNFAPNYVDILLDVSKRNNGAAVGSAIVEERDHHKVVSIGPRVDLWRLGIWDAITDLSDDERLQPNPTYQVDALSGRGTLYRAELFQRHGMMRPRLLPHYLADYELAMRFARDGKVPLLVSTRATVISPPTYGNATTGFSWWTRLFSRKSSANIIYGLTFFLLVGSPLQRATSPLRLLLRVVRNKLASRSERTTA